MKRRTAFIRAAILFTSLYFATPVMAQDDFDFDPGDPDTEVPFDSGVPILIAAALAYGAKRLYSIKSAEKIKKMAAA